MRCAAGFPKAILTLRSQISFSLPLGMGEPTRNEFLTECFLRAAGVAAPVVDADGNVGAQDVAKIEAEAAQVVYCCPPAVFHLFGTESRGHCSDMDCAVPTVS